MRRNRPIAWRSLLVVAVLAAGNLNLATSLAAEHAGAEEHAGEHTSAANDSDGHAAGGHATAGEGAGSPNPLGFDPDLAIFTAIVFGCLMFLLGKFAWPAISTALVEREQRIEASISDAEAMNLEAKNMLAQHEAKLATAADQVRELLDEARRDAEHTKTQILTEAKELAGQERERAVRDVERAADHAMQNLAESSANMAVDLAGKVVRQNITADQQAALVREALGKLARSSPSEN
jgi:F-type H+-transporting ATPase subunit b